MASPPTLDLDALIAPVPGDAPAGNPEPAEIDLVLKRLRADIEAADPAGSDGSMVEGGGARGRWGEVAEKAADVLTAKSKHVEAAVRLAEAVARKDGVPGLRDGLRLLQRLAADCWDRVHPLPEEGAGFDPREGRLRWLNEVNSGARFPYSILRLPLVTAGGRAFCYLDWVQKESKAEFEAALPGTDVAKLRATYADLLETRQALRDLSAALDAKLGADSPDFLSEENTANIGTALEQCVGLVEEVAHRKGVSLTEVPAAAAPTAAGTPEAPAAAAAGVAPGAQRADLYRQIKQVAAALRALEPHSPIPYLLDRCVRLGELPFPQLAREIIREAATLDELDRLLGIENPKPPAG